MPKPMSLLAASILLLAAGCSALSPAPRVGNVPLYEGLGTNSRRIRTQSADAQRYFDQGLDFLFAFNHDEAIRSFRRAAELDPSAPMPWWGVAAANGPHINNPAMSAAQSAAAWDALARARELARNGDSTEAGLIEALGSRYRAEAPADRSALDLAYADSMRRLWAAHPDDPDVGALFAEALMDLRPWNQWTPAGDPQPGTEEVLATLEKTLALDAEHPLALHLTIHALEASRQPARAARAADRLRGLQPGLGHMEHMPSHIDVRLGHWARAIASNASAIRADTRYRALSGRQGFYGLYMAHNHHMLAFAAMMAGRRAEATAAIDGMAAAIPPAWAREFPGIADGYLAMPLEVRIRFGAWDEVLAAADPGDAFPFAQAMRHYARGVAFAARGDVASARGEKTAFDTRRAALPADSMFGNNKGGDLLAVADRVLEGEIAWRDGKRDAAITSLRRAVELEEALRYDEPPSWILPARHTLGAVLLEAGRARDAEGVFRRDLEVLPENGWALFGLSRALSAQGRRADAAAADRRFREAWKDADYAITSPCACLARPARGR